MCGTDLYACREGDQEPGPRKSKTSARENSVEERFPEEKAIRDHEYRMMQLQLEREVKLEQIKLEYHRIHKGVTPFVPPSHVFVSNPYQHITQFDESDVCKFFE